MFTDHQEAAMQVPVTASLGEVPATVLPTRFAQTSGVVLPPLTTPSTVRQMIYIPPNSSPWRAPTAPGRLRNRDPLGPQGHAVAVVHPERPSRKADLEVLLEDVGFRLGLDHNHRGGDETRKLSPLKLLRSR